MDAEVQVEDANEMERIERFGLIANSLDSLIRGSQNVTLHMKILKRLLNLQDNPKPTFDFISPSPPMSSSPSTALESSSTSNNPLCSVDNDSMPPTNYMSEDDPLRQLVDKCDALKKELELWHSFGHCFAHNLQRLHQQLTGCPVDLFSAEQVMEKLKVDHDRLKTNEAINRYDLQQKRKLVGRLRDQLEVTREEWKNFIIKQKNSESEWKRLREEFQRRRDFDGLVGDDDTETDPDCEPPGESSSQ